MPAGIFRAWRRAWMECADTVEPFQHPQTAWEGSCRGAMALAGRKKKKKKHTAEQWQGGYRGCGGARAGVAGADPVCVGETTKWSRELQRELQWRLEIRELEEEEAYEGRKRSEAPPVAYMGGGGEVVGSDCGGGGWGGRAARKGNRPLGAKKPRG